mmetsp:Transcript_5223/g.8927  ORF Transcript_5223/g.8927 Transcript_5223/m.8927 type:complete len:89 (+) Transcript_5223:1565-1831(+)
MPSWQRIRHVKWKCQKKTSQRQKMRRKHIAKETLKSEVLDAKRSLQYCEMIAEDKDAKLLHNSHCIDLQPTSCPHSSRWLCLQSTQTE